MPILAMQQAIADAGLEESDVSNERTGLIAGLGRAVDARTCSRRTAR